jgi:hypothetical protein
MYSGWRRTLFLLHDTTAASAAAGAAAARIAPTTAGANCQRAVQTDSDQYAKVQTAKVIDLQVLRMES